MARPRTRLLWAGMLAVAVVAVSLGVWAFAETRPPTVTCSTPDTVACADTRNWIVNDRSFVFARPLPARLVSVDVRPTPPEWKRLANYREGGWAALLTMAGREPVLVACYYSSDDMVACDDP